MSKQVVRRGASARADARPQPASPAVIFDFDGTLADSFDIMVEILYQLTGRPRVPAQEIEQLRQLSLKQAARALHLPRWKILALLLRGRRKMHARIGEVKAFAGICPLIRALHEDGRRLFIISSNSQKNVRQFLRDNQLEECFDGVHGGVSLFGKSRALRKVLRANSLRPRNCVYVGDEVRDIAAARLAHVRIAAVGWGYNAPGALQAHKPFAFAATPADLATILREKV